MDIRSTDEPYYQDLIVGPLPVTNDTKIEPLNFPYNKGVGYQRNPSADYSLRYEFLTNVTKQIADITLDTFGFKITGEDDDSGYMWGIDPLWKENNRTISWEIVWGNPENEFWDSTTLLPQGL